MEDKKDTQREKENSLARRRTHIVAGALVAFALTYVFIKNPIFSVIGAIIGATLAYFDTTHYDLIETLRKFAGIFLGIYGILAVLAPDKYPIAQLPTSLVALAGLVCIVGAVFLLR